MGTVKKIPQRQCIGCGSMSDKKSLVRIIKTKEQEILVDFSGKKNGRGAYICKNIECLKKAVKSKGLERAFKMSIDKSIYEMINEEFQAELVVANKGVDNND